MTSQAPNTSRSAEPLHCPAASDPARHAQACGTSHQKTGRVAAWTSSSTRARSLYFERSSFCPKKYPGNSEDHFINIYRYFRPAARTFIKNIIASIPQILSLPPFQARWPQALPPQFNSKPSSLQKSKNKGGPEIHLTRLLKNLLDRLLREAEYYCFRMGLWVDRLPPHHHHPDQSVLHHLLPLQPHESQRPPD